jgi:hypothetical protein
MFSIKRIVQNLTQLSILIFICSFVRLYIYYSEFSIDIIPYIDISEVPKYTLDR